MDQHLTPEIGTGLFYSAEQAPDRQEFLDLVLERLRRVRTSTVKRVREREFSVWHGRFTTTLGDDLVGLLLPDPIDIRVYRCFADLTRLPGFVEQADYAPEDAHAVPLARYERGVLVAYLGAGAPPVAPDAEVEVRSAVVEARPRRAPRHPLPEPGYVAPRFHDLTTWADTREAVMRWVFGLRAPGSYRGLRRIVDRSFGISVRERRQLATDGFGYIHTGWMDGGEEVLVSIVLRADLSTDLKYVVLAHELAHYVLHFPLLHLARRAEEVARGVPEVGPAFRQAMHRHLSRAQVELHADVFASNLLVPPWADLARWSEVMVEVGHDEVSPEEHAWRILTPLFRETAARPMGWSGYDEMRAMASQDLAELRERPAATLFERMLRAVIVRIDGGETALTETVSDGMQSIINEMEHLAAQMFQADPESVRAVVRATLGDESEPTPWDPATGSFDVVPPVVPDPSGLHRFIALEPAPGNPRGDDAGGWIDHHAPHRPAGSLRSWRALAPEDVALRIYRPLP